MHTIDWPIKRHQGLWFVTWKWTWYNIWFFLPKEEYWITIAHTWLSHRGIGITTKINRLSLIPMYRHLKLMIQRIQIFLGHLMEFIYALRLNYRVDTRLRTCGRDNWLQDQNYLRYLSKMLWSTMLINGGRAGI